MEKLIKEYLDYLKYIRGYQENTINSYLIELTKYSSYLKEKKINYLIISKDEIYAYLKYLDDLGYKNSSVARHLSALRGFYEYLEKEKKTKVNVFSFIKGPKKDKILPHYFEYNEIEELFSVNDMSKPLEVRNQLILELLYATGIRVSELVNIKLSDISLQRLHENHRRCH